MGKLGGQVRQKHVEALGLAREVGCGFIIRATVSRICSSVRGSMGRLLFE